MSHGEASAARFEQDAVVSGSEFRPPDVARVPFDRLIRSHLSFVGKVAAEYRGMGLHYEDLLNEGNVGLVEAAHRFDPARGTKFATYASWWIRRSILRALADQPRMIRLPDYQRKELKRVRDAERELGAELGRQPDTAEISQRLSRSIEHVERMRRSRLRELRIDMPVGEDGAGPLSESLADEVLPSPEDVVIRAQALQLVSRAFSMLSRRERDVLQLRYGLGDTCGLSLAKVGECLGLSGERVRQIESGAITRLRQILRSSRIGVAPPKRLRPSQRI